MWLILRQVRKTDYLDLQKLVSSLKEEGIHLSAKQAKIDNFVDDPAQIMLIAKVGNELVGVISAGKRSAELEKYHWLELFVESKYRKKGIATRLLKTLIEECRLNEHIQGLFLTVNRSNSNAIRLYYKHGFIKEKGFSILFFTAINMSMQTN